MVSVCTTTSMIGVLMRSGRGGTGKYERGMWMWGFQYVHDGMQRGVQFLPSFFLDADLVVAVFVVDVDFDDAFAAFEVFFFEGAAFLVVLVRVFLGLSDCG